MSAQRELVLVVDDEPRMTRFIRMNLELEGYRVIEAHDGLEALDKVRTNLPALVILDAMMPELDGFETLGILRETSSVPVIMLTVRADEEDKVRGLELGADDYVPKPFGLGELKARIEALLRRTRRLSPDPADTIYDDGNLRIDLRRQQVYRQGSIVNLSRREFALLACLVQQLGQVISHRDLLASVWGQEYADATGYLSLYVRYLRQKLEDDPSNPRYIITRWGVGYFFAPHDGESEQ